MIAIGKEPEGLLLRKRDVMNWLPGMTEAEWTKVRPSLAEVRLPGHEKPYYRKAEVREKLVALVLAEV